MTEPHTKALVVALPADDDPLAQGQPGQDVDPHITVCYFGEADQFGPRYRRSLRDTVSGVADVMDPFEAKINGTGSLGDDDAKVLLLESPDLATLRELLMASGPVSQAMSTTEQFPHYIPHLTWSYGDEPPSDLKSMRIGKLGLWVGDNREEFPLGSNPDGLLAAGEEAAPAAAAAPVLLTPETTDVAPIYLALTDAVDKDAVLDVLAMVPATKDNPQPIVYTRGKNGWVLDEAMRTAMLSTNPPPLVSLDPEAAKGVIEQVDTFYKREPSEKKEDEAGAPAAAEASLYDGLQVYSEFGELYRLPDTEDAAAMYAAGGLDRNRGGAEKLRRYWTTGKGGAKIRWGTGGDWYRCVRHLSKYLGPRAKGYCQLRHQEMTGVYTSTHAKMVRQGKRGRLAASGADQAVIDAAASRAISVSASATFLPGTATEVAPEGAPEHGARFRIPLVVPEGVETGDGRRFAPLALTTRELPIPLLWQVRTAEGHDGSVVVGRIDTIDRIKNGLGNATGVFDVGPYGREVERLVRGKFLRGVSADLDKFEATTEQGLAEDGDDEKAPDPNKIGGNKMLIDKARVSAVTVVAKPAFEECTITLVDDDSEQGL